MARLERDMESDRFSAMGESDGRGGGSQHHSVLTKERRMLMMQEKQGAAHARKEQTAALTLPHFPPFPPLVADPPASTTRTVSPTPQIKDGPRVQGYPPDQTVSDGDVEVFMWRNIVSLSNEDIDTLGTAMSKELDSVEIDFDVTQLTAKRPLNNPSDDRSHYRRRARDDEDAEMKADASEVLQSMCVDGTYERASEWVKMHSPSGNSSKRFAQLLTLCLSLSGLQTPVDVRCSITFPSKQRMQLELSHYCSVSLKALLSVQGIHSGLLPRRLVSVDFRRKVIGIVFADD